MQESRPVYPTDWHEAEETDYNPTGIGDHGQVGGEDFAILRTLSNDVLSYDPFGSDANNGVILPPEPDAQGGRTWPVLNERMLRRQRSPLGRLVRQVGRLASRFIPGHDRGTSQSYDSPADKHEAAYLSIIDKVDIVERPPYGPRPSGEPDTDAFIPPVPPNVNL